MVQEEEYPVSTDLPRHTVKYARRAFSHTNTVPDSAIERIKAGNGTVVWVINEKNLIVLFELLRNWRIVLYLWHSLQVRNDSGEIAAILRLLGIRLSLRLFEFVLCRGKMFGYFPLDSFW